MTLHGPGIIQMIGEAQSTLRRHRQQLPEFLDDLPAQQFLDAVPDQTAWLLTRSIHVLSHQFEGGVIRRKSFSTWILPKMLREVLRLTSIVKATPVKLRAFCAHTDPVAVAWRNIKEYDPVGWSAQLIQASGCGKNVVYERRRQWLAEFDVDIAVPYIFFRDLEVLGRQLRRSRTREALLEALGEGDGEETVRLLGEAADSLRPYVAAGRDCGDIVADAFARQDCAPCHLECVRGLEARACCRDPSWSSPRAVGQVHAPRVDQKVSAPRARPSPQAQASRALVSPPP